MVPEPLAVEGELRDVGQVDVVEEEYLRHLEVLLVEPLQGLGLDPPLHDLAQAHEEGLAHLVGDVVRPCLLVEDAEEEVVPEEVEREGRLEGPDERDRLSVLVHLEHGVEGERPLEGLLGDVQVRDLGEEAEAVPLDPDLLLELEVLQLRGDERQVPLLLDDEDLSRKDQDAGRPFKPIQKLIAGFGRRDRHLHLRLAPIIPFLAISSILGSVAPASASTFIGGDKLLYSRGSANLLRELASQRVFYDSWHDLRQLQEQP